MTDYLFEAADLEHEPLAQASTIPSSWYVDPRFHQIDLESILHATWQYVGPSERVREAGSFITGMAAQNPVIVVRDKDGDLNAFFNVCKHRGGPLETADCGHARMLQCKYHGWTYRLDGSLRGVPRFERTDLFDKKDFGLTKVRVQEWQGMVFVNSGGEAGGFEEMVDGIRETIAPFDMSSLHYSNRVVYDVACNWKVYVDNYLEGYHLPLVHPELCDALSYSDYVTETFPNYSLQHASFRDDTTERAFYYFVYPNIMLNILPGRLQVNSVVPVSSEKTRVIFDYFYSDVAGGDAAARIKEDQDFADRVQWEDIEICEHVQRGLNSVAYDRGRFSVETESGVHHFQDLLKKSYRHYVEKHQR